MSNIPNNIPVVTVTNEFLNLAGSRTKNDKDAVANISNTLNNLLSQQGLDLTNIINLQNNLSKAQNTLDSNQTLLDTLVAYTSAIKLDLSVLQSNSVFDIVSTVESLQNQQLITNETLASFQSIISSLCKCIMSLMNTEINNLQNNINAIYLAENLTPIITGNFGVFINSTTVYTISNYVSLNTYDVSVSNGTVTIYGNTITVIAPYVVGEIILTINNVNFIITVMADTIYVPYITSPSGGSSNNPINNLTITSSAFNTIVGLDTHVSSTWQLATDSLFTNIVQSSINSTINLNSWTVTGLSVSIMYYVQVSYTGSSGESSQISPITTFST